MNQANRSLLQELEERLRFETLLVDISAGFVNLRADQIDGEIEHAQSRVCECLGADMSALWLWSVETPYILTLTHLYRPLGGPPPPDRANANQLFPWCLQQLSNGLVLAVSSMDQLPPEAARDQEVWRQYGIRSTLAIPLSAGQRPPIGVLSFDTTRAERTWSEAFVNRIQVVAQIFTNALARKRSEEMLRESEERLNLAAASADAGLWVTDLRTSKVWVTAKTRELFNLSPDEDVNRESFYRVIPSEDREQVRQAVQAAVQSGNELNVEHRIVLPDGTIRWIVSRGRSHSSPSGEPEKLMGVSIDITGRKHNEEQLRQAQIVALHEAEIRHQMERIELDLGVARDIQQGLLPRKPPIVDGFDIAGWNLPADATGGDYYDWQELRNGKLVVSLGDVTGHGVGPALVAAECRAYARASFAHSTNLHDTVSHLNRLLLEDLPVERSVAYVALILDRTINRFDISSAGHGPVLLYKAAVDQFEEIDAQGVPLGLFSDLPYEESPQYEMAPGDMLVLITDGFFEWANPEDEQFGISRLKQSLRSSQGFPASEMIARLYADVLQFAGGTPQIDDLTAVIVRRKQAV